MAWMGIYQPCHFRYIRNQPPFHRHTQRIGRMGELAVELELLARGWMVGNFNSTTANSAGWDLFATKGGRSVRIRVKEKRPGTSCFVWPKKRDGRVFDLLAGDVDDFVAAVNFEAGGLPGIYILPAARAAWACRARPAMTGFRSTRPRRARRRKVPDIITANMFRSTRLRRARLPHLRKLDGSLLFRSTRPRRARPTAAVMQSAGAVFRSTRREGRDAFGQLTGSQSLCFDPHAREGRDGSSVSQ